MRSVGRYTRVMRRPSSLPVAGILVAAGAMSFGLIPSAASVRAFKQCPSAGLDTSCQFLIEISDQGLRLRSDPAQRAYDGNKDSLIGVQNNSSRAVASMSIRGENLFAFDGDGLCNSGTGPAPSGCQPPPGSSGVSCNPSTVRTNHCSFPPPPGEPPNYTEPRATDDSESGGGPITPAAPWPNGDVQNGYEGPRTWFSDVPADAQSGVVHFSPPLAPRESTYFSLEEGLGPDTTILIGSVARTLTAVRLSASGRSGTRLVVRHGKPVRAVARINGPTRIAASWGTVTYTVFRDKTCKRPMGKPSTVTVDKGHPLPSAAFRPGIGTYYATARYSGDAVYAPSVSRCGAAVFRVLAR
jgi:hypothetical protein